MQSFIRAYVLDNVYICVLMHILFYVALWYATTVSKINFLRNFYSTTLPPVVENINFSISELSFK